MEHDSNILPMSCNSCQPTCNCNCRTTKNAYGLKLKTWPFGKVECLTDCCGIECCNECGQDQVVVKANKIRDNTCNGLCGFSNLRGLLANSSKNIVIRKYEILKNKLNNIKHLAYFPFGIGYNNSDIPFEELFRETSDNKKKSCSIFLQKFHNSKLSVSELRNLYNNLLSQILSENFLNLNFYVQVNVENKGYKNVPKEYIQYTVTQITTEFIYCVVVNSIYGEEIMNYNYAELFNFAYFYLTTVLYYNQHIIFSFSSGSVILEFNPKM
jgi:hypothetical protein